MYIDVSALLLQLRADAKRCHGYQVYKNIEISAGEEDSIIVFYNRVFMVKLKSYLLQFQSPTPHTKVSSNVAFLGKNPQRMLCDLTIEHLGEMLLADFGR